MTSLPRRSVFPIYTSHGDAEAFLVYPYLYNRQGEWIGWVTADRRVYSVLGLYVGEMTADLRIIRERVTALLTPRKNPPACPPHLSVPATIPLAPLMGDLRFGLMDVLLEEPDRLHTIDAGELRKDLD